MGITIAIVAGVIVVTVISGYFDYLGKKEKNSSPRLAQRIDELEKRLNLLDAGMTEKDDKIKQLTDEITFVNKLLEKKG
jgi:hypothetical protein